MSLVSISNFFGVIVLTVVGVLADQIPHQITSHAGMFESGVVLAKLSLGPMHQLFGE